MKTTQSPLRDYLDTNQVQRILGIRHDYLRLKIRKGKIPGIKVGTCHFVHVRALADILKKQGHSREKILQIFEELEKGRI